MTDLEIRSELTEVEKSLTALPQEPQALWEEVNRCLQLFSRVHTLAAEAGENLTIAEADASNEFSAIDIPAREKERKIQLRVVQWAYTAKKVDGILNVLSKRMEQGRSRLSYLKEEMRMGGFH